MHVLMGVGVRRRYAQSHYLFDLVYKLGLYFGRRYFSEMPAFEKIKVSGIKIAVFGNERADFRKIGRDRFARYELQMNPDREARISLGDSRRIRRVGGRCQKRGRGENAFSESGFYGVANALGKAEIIGVGYKIDLRHALISLQ